MSKNNENKLVPVYRFPEFIKDEGWEETTLGKISYITNGKSNAQDHIENGKYPLFDRSAVIKASNNFLFDCEAVIIPGEGMRFTPKYYKGKFDLHQRAYVLKDFTIDGMFAYYSMSHRSDLLALKAVKSTVLSLRLPILQNFPIQIPKKQSEQQKIASCLSSLDEVITAESKKLEVLKEHKKGLLQNLFPQSRLNRDLSDSYDKHDAKNQGNQENQGSDNVPKVRFKEFEDSGEWVEKKLGDIANFTGGGTPSKSNADFWQGNIPWISSSDVEEDSIHQIKITRFITEEALKESATKLVPPNSVLLVSRVGVGRLAVSTQPLCTSQDFTNFSPVNDDSIFLGYYLKSKREILLSFSQGMAIKGFTKDDISKLELLIPSKSEQQKIASCLSSIDELIIAQGQKIETLKLHKKGLLQGLFPNLNEVTA